MEKFAAGIMGGGGGAAIGGGGGGHGGADMTKDMCAANTGEFGVRVVLCWSQ